jgi:hypothetical protein
MLFSGCILNCCDLKKLHEKRSHKKLLYKDTTGDQQRNHVRPQKKKRQFECTLFILLVFIAAVPLHRVPAPRDKYDLQL